MTVASNFHIEVNASDAGIYDRLVIQEMIKNIAQSQQLDIGGQREFKGDPLNNAYSIKLSNETVFSLFYSYHLN